MVSLRQQLCRTGRRRLYAALAVLALALTLARPPLAAAGEATTVVSTLVATALGTLGDKQLSAHDRDQRLRLLLEQDFDVPHIAHFVLGTYWDNASDAERQTFIGLFEEWIVASYTDGFKDYHGETIVVTGSHPGNADTMIVSSEVVELNGEHGAKLDWVLRRDADSFKVINISVEGMSLVMIERDQMLAVVAHHGGTVGGANGALEAKLAPDGGSHEEKF